PRRRRTRLDPAARFGHIPPLPRRHGGRGRGRGGQGMNIALCYESVLPSRGGCETYIASLARRLAADGHDLHLYAARWEPEALPAPLHSHRVAVPRLPRFLRPWCFAHACRRQLARASHQVTVGFDRLPGLDVVYPQGGLYAACAEGNLRKYRHAMTRRRVRWPAATDPAHPSFLAIERRQYRARPLVVAISEMVRRDLERFEGLRRDVVRVVRVATNPDRFDEFDRPRRRLEWRQTGGFGPREGVGPFAGRDYRPKGLGPLLHSPARPARPPGPPLLGGGGAGGGA